MGLKQLILMEEFQNSMPEEMKTNLNERKLKSSHEMAILADEYDIVHKKTKVRTTASTLDITKISDAQDHPRF